MIYGKRGFGAVRGDHQSAHHYHKIGLLQPAEISEGYRLCDRAGTAAHSVLQGNGFSAGTNQVLMKETPERQMLLQQEKLLMDRADRCAILKTAITEYGGQARSLRLFKGF